MTAARHFGKTHCDYTKLKSCALLTTYRFCSTSNIVHTACVSVPSSYPNLSSAPRCTLCLLQPANTCQTMCHTAVSVKPSNSNLLSVCRGTQVYPLLTASILYMYWTWFAQQCIQAQQFKPNFSMCRAKSVPFACSIHCAYMLHVFCIAVMAKSSHPNLFVNV